jgi:hypothetical protein
MSYDRLRERNQGSQHECAAPGCHEMISRRLLMCAAHWRTVPAPLQHAVLRTWRNGGAGAYLAARNAAIEAVSGGQS